MASIAAKFIAPIPIGQAPIGAIDPTGLYRLPRAILLASILPVCGWPASSPDRQSFRSLVILIARLIARRADR